MKEEIKEYLDYFKKYATISEKAILEDIEDHITNLQKENRINNDLIPCFKNREKELKKQINVLQEENKRYKKLFEGKERFSKIMPDDMDFIVMSKTDYDRQVDDIELVALELRSRIDKGISLLKEAGCYDEETKTFCDDVWEELPELLNILQGEEE